MASTRSKLDEIVESFSTLEDPRSQINRRHPLPGILVIAVLAVLAGAAGPTAIARWAKYKEELLTGLLDLPRGVPGKDVFRRVLMLLKPEALETCFNAWIARLRDEAIAETGVERPIVAIDGKSARRSHDAAGLSDRYRPCYTAAVAAGKMADRCRRGRLKSSSGPRSEGNAFFGIASGEPRRRHGCLQSRKPRPGGQKPRTPCPVVSGKTGSKPDIRTRLPEQAAACSVMASGNLAS